MAPGVYETFVVYVVCSPLTCREKMIRFYVFPRDEWDMTQHTSVSLFPVQYQPLFLGGFPAHLVLLALRPVVVQRWVIGGVLPGDLGEAGDRGCIGFDQFRLSFPECPIAIVPKITGFHPLPAFGRVAAFRPYPEHLPLGMSNLLKDVFGCTVPGIMRPAPDDRVKCFNDVPCRGLLMGVQVGSYCPHVFEDFFLLWDAQQCALFPEFPAVKPQKVQPCCKMHAPGFGFAERQTACVEKLFHPWSRIGFPYFSCRGRDHKVISIAYDRYPLIESCTRGRGLGLSLWPFGLKQPFHPIQCHMGQQWGYDSALWRAGVRGRKDAAFDAACVQPSAHRGGEDRQFGQQGARGYVVKTAADVCVEHPCTAVLLAQCRMEGFHGIHRAAPWAEALGVGFKTRLPLRFQGCFDDCLHHPVLSGRYAQGALLAVVFWDVYPSDRPGLVPLQAQALLKQLPAGFRRVVHHSIDACRVFPLVFLGDTSERQELGGRGSNKQFLKIFYPLPCRVRGGAIDTLLQSSYITLHRVPIDIGPCGVGLFCSPCSEWSHRLTSPKIRTLHNFSTVRTRRKFAPFQVGYPRVCGPIRPITGRRSLFPSSSTLCSIPLPCGRDTTDVGSIGLTQLLMKKNVVRSGWSLYPGGRSDVVTPSRLR